VNRLVQSDLTSGDVVEFGPYHLDVARRQLRRGGQLLSVGGRAFEILYLLLSRAGAVVEKQEIMEVVWPGLFVEDANLRVQISTLRRLLHTGGDDSGYIVNVAGRGYRFVADVRLPNPLAAGGPVVGPAGVQTGVPTRLTRVIGRNELVERLTGELLEHQCISIVGPGGIGKTTVAVSLATSAASLFPDGINFIDFAPLQDASLAPNTVASSLGLPVRSENETESILAFLRGRRRLLIFDNCEHVINMATPLVEQICAAAPGVHVVATSREMLAAEGEFIHRLVPLAIPPALEQTIDGIASYSAVQLFVERATAIVQSFKLTRKNAGRIAEICRRLDGIPLALELAAGSVDAFGIEGLAQGLDDRFNLLTKGRRTALPRQRTLRLTLDWSHDLLSTNERKVLRRLGCFAGSFSLDAAKGVVCDSVLSPEQLTTAVSNLVAKSLLSNETISGSLRYRLLETTRVYALEHLAASLETAELRLRHATWFCNFLREARKNSDGGSLKNLSPDLDNVRIALSWAYSIDGDHVVGTDLAVAAAPLFLDLSLFVECLAWTRKGLEQLQPFERGTSTEMELTINYAMPFLYIHGNDPRVKETLERGYELACVLGDTGYQARFLDGIYIYYLRGGHIQKVIEVSAQATTLYAMTGDPLSSHLWMAGFAHHLAGDHQRAIEYSSSALEQLPLNRQIETLRTGVDPRLHAGGGYARSLWMSGHGEEAINIAAQVVSEAAETGSLLSLNASLGWTTPLALWMGDLELARERAARMEQIAQQNNLRPAGLVATGFQGAIAIRSGEPHKGVSLLEQSVIGLGKSGNGLYEIVLMTFWAEGLLDCGQHDRAMAVIVDALALCEQRGEKVSLPPLLRLQARVYQKMNAERALVLGCLKEALERAREQGALLYENEILDFIASLEKNEF
jgi:predicted ATPase/DNA-binding winged helix-turn-helix (wHTH) protein